MRVHFGHALLFDEHLDRLLHDSQQLGFPLICRHSLQQSVTEQLKVLDHVPVGVCKLLISRGDSERGYMPSVNIVPKLFINVSEYTQHSVEASLDHNQNLALAKIRLAHQPQLAGLKHGSRLEQVMASRERQMTPFDDLFLCDQNDHLIETIAANVFILCNGVWLTPSLDNAGVSGVMRNFILTCMRDNQIAVQEQSLHYSILSRAQSVFTCNALTILKSVSSFVLDEQTYRFDSAPCEGIFDIVQTRLLQKGSY